MAGNERSGRKPKREGLRVLPGGARAGGTLKTTPGVPAPSAEIEGDEVALRYYRGIGAELDGLGVMRLEYGQALSTLAGVCADLERVRGQYADAGRVAFGTGFTDDGDPKVIESPILKRLMDLSALKMRLLGDFGLTPVAAAKVGQVTGPRELSKWERLTLPARKA